MARITYLTSESVTQGHPDKLADQISDAVLDDIIRQDSQARVAVECLVKNSMVIVAGELSTTGYSDIQGVVRGVVRDVGYTDPAFGIDWQDCAVLVSVSGQSPDIAQGVDNGLDQGAGDQGMMYGFACDETPELMPLPIMLAHKLARRLAVVREQGLISGLGPDGKSQVSVEYHDGVPKRVSAVVLGQQHLDSVSEESLRELLLEHVVAPVCGAWIDDDTALHINATGRFVIGGPEGDAGLTGRKIVVDTYGGVGRVGGGAFSGKDPSKVDRSGAYMARYVAKNIVAAGLARRCELQLSYSIGVAEPTSINIDTAGTSSVDEELLERAVLGVFDFRPSAIIKQLDLLKPVFRQTAAYGHFGREEFSWERVDKVSALQQAVKKISR